MQTDQPLTDAERTLPPHLGGHFGNVNKDAVTLRFLVERYGIRTMIDVGCGPGGMLDEAGALGVDAVGVDGDPFVAEADPRIFCHDYATGPAALWFQDIDVFERTVIYDLVWSMEFVEHVAPEYQEHFLRTFDRGTKALYLTAAPPGFPGHHHVNCQPAHYWVDLLAQRGWALDEEATAWVRQNGGHVFSQRQGLVFTKIGPSS